MSRGRHSARYVSLGNLPSARKEYSIDYDKLDGGLNLWELPYKLDPNQSPDMVNLLWADGILASRKGQTYELEKPNLGKGLCCTDADFWGVHFFHIGTGLYYADMNAEQIEYTQIYDGLPQERGCFFRYGDFLYYKTVGAYIYVKFDPEKDEPFSAADVEPYIPVSYLNLTPTSKSGDAYQPENRLTNQQTLKYTATSNNTTIDAGSMRAWSYNSSTKSYTYSISAGKIYRVKRVYYKNNDTDVSLPYMYDSDAKSISVSGNNYQSSTIYIEYEYPANVYYLPVFKNQMVKITKIVADGEIKVQGTDYNVNQYDSAAGRETQINFLSGHEPDYNPNSTNTVAITIAIEDSSSAQDGYDSVMSCRYATTFGGENDLCIVLGGCARQPNAYFWNANNIAMDAGYFPYANYNLCGDTEDRITGLHKQAGYLMIFKEHSIGRAKMGTTIIDGRAMISMDYTMINSKAGCDLPWSIQLIENNLVFCNTYQGVHMITNTTAALENNVIGISRNVNGTQSYDALSKYNREGLLAAVRAADPMTVCSYDDDQRYWLCVNDKVYLWDYVLSDYKDPSWFYFEGIPAICFFQSADERYHLSSDGSITRFNNDFRDYGQAIYKKYVFASQYFGTYDRLKDVTGVMFVVRSDSDTAVDVRYKTDYGEWKDATLVNGYSWRVFPRNLSFRYLGTKEFATSAKRRPGLHHIRHFTMILTNNNMGQDLSIVSAHVYYKYSGRER